MSELLLTEAIPAPLTVEEALAGLGLENAQYRRLTSVWGWSWYSPPQLCTSPDGMGKRLAAPEVMGAKAVRLSADGVYELGDIIRGDARDLFRSHAIRNEGPRGWVDTRWPVEDLGLDPVAAKAWYDAELERRRVETVAENAQRALALAGALEFACLPRSVQADLNKRARGEWSPWPAELAGLWAEAQALHHRQQAGEILVNWGGPQRLFTGSGNAGFFVLQSDGAQRQPDTRPYWRVVADEELALVYSLGSLQSAPVCTIAHRPPVITPEQLAATAELEVYLKVPQGAFGLDETLNRVFDTRLQAIREVLHEFPEDLLGRPVEELAFTYAQISGRNGLKLEWVDLYSLTPSSARLIDNAQPCDRQCEARAAWQVIQRPAADGTVEIVFYHKFGRDNLNLRWWPSEPVNESAEAESPTELPPLAEGLAALQEQFGRPDRRR